MATQAERTAHTRERLLEATIAVLVSRGYRNASLPEICKKAGVSRGAQLHHFPMKEELVAAAVEHLFERRMKELRDRISRTDVLDLREAATIMWGVYIGPTYYAWLELVVAARTDEDLRTVLAKIDARLVAGAEAICKEFLLPHVDDKMEIAATTRLILAIFDGLGTHRIVSGDDALPKKALAIAAKAGLFTKKGRQA